MPPIAYVQGATAGVAPGFTLGTTFASSNTAGNLLVAGVFSPGVGAPTSITDTAGNTYHLAVSVSSATYLYYAYNINAKTGNFVKVVFSGSNYYEVCVIEYSGVQSSSSPLDGTGTYSGTTSTGATLPITTTASGDLLYTMIEASNSGSGYAASGGATNRYNFNFGSSMVQDQLAGAAGPYVTGCTYTSAQNTAAVVAGFKPQGAVAAVLPTDACFFGII